MPITRETVEFLRSVNIDVTNVFQTIKYMDINFNRLFTNSSKEPFALQAMCELCIEASRLEQNESASFIISACIYSYKLSYYNAHFINLYNKCVEKLFISVCDQIFVHPIPQTISAIRGEPQLIIRGRNNLVDTQKLILLKEYQRYYRKRFTQLPWHDRFGFGVALAGVLNNQSFRGGRRWKIRRNKHLILEPKFIKCITALFYVDRETNEAVLEFVDTDRYQNISADWTTSLLYHTFELQKSSRALRIPPISGVIHFEKYKNYEGLYFITPFCPNKVPLIFVHGFISSVETWIPIVNHLLPPDARVWEKYQIAFFQYPTGQSLLYVAMNLRIAMDGLRQLYGDGRNKYLKQTTLITHSIGGVLARLIVSDSRNDDLFKLIFGEKTVYYLDESFSRLLYWDKLDFIGTLIFIAVPHGGIGGYKILEIALKRLVKLPKLLANSLYQNTNEENVDMMMFGSIKYESPVVKFLDSHPVPTKTKFHSIYAKCKENYLLKSTREKDTDGTVAVKSAQLDGASSELLLTDNHIHIIQNAQCLERIKEILLLQT